MSLNRRDIATSKTAAGRRRPYSHLGDAVCRHPMRRAG